jgi:predicted RND superfamily exporter protein
MKNSRHNCYGNASRPDLRRSPILRHGTRATSPPDDGQSYNNPRRDSGRDLALSCGVRFVAIVGLASENAILIVEFAKMKREEGLSAHDAAVEACRVRLRPIVMTSFAFILGVVPLMLGHGAEMRFALAVAVVAGMIGVTVFSIFMTPVFFVVVQWFTKGKVVPPADKAVAVAVAHEADLNASAPRPDSQSVQTKPTH